MKPREQKLREGQARNEAWREMSPAEQLRSLKARRGESKRQVKKLMALMGVQS